MTDEERGVTLVNIEGRPWGERMRDCFALGEPALKREIDNGAASRCHWLSRRGVLASRIRSADFKPVIIWVLFDHTGPLAGRTAGAKAWNVMTPFEAGGHRVWKFATGPAS